MTEKYQSIKVSKYQSLTFNFDNIGIAQVCHSHWYILSNFKTKETKKAQEKVIIIMIIMIIIILSAFLILNLMQFHGVPDLL